MGLDYYTRECFYMNKKNGFTLVELLAVIVILAVILVIAVPSIMSTITESRKGALASSAKLIASSAETAYISNQTLGIEKTIECRDISNYTDEDYESCTITFDSNGKAKVTIVGKGKFEGMGVFLGTKDNAVATEGLITDDTDDHNIRYAGASPKNYIKFNDELWRIIGIFNVKTVNETTGEEKTEKLMKIVRNSTLKTNMSWDSSPSSVNNGSGVNEWSQADLMTMLNTYYIGTSTTCNYCIKASQATCSNSCSSIITPLGNTYASMVEEVVWNTGAIEWDANGITVETAYNAERGTTTGKKCTSGIYCSDTVTRTTTWPGKVGLIYPSDYGYASTNTSCRANIYDCTNYPCMNTNWLHSFEDYWTISPYARSGDAGSASYVFSGYVTNSGAANGHGVRPAIYLKSDVFITSGDGSEGNPYVVSMN